MTFLCNLTTRTVTTTKITVKVKHSVNSSLIQNVEQLLSQLHFTSVVAFAQNS